LLPTFNESNQQKNKGKWRVNILTLNEGTMIQVKNPHQPNYEFEKVMTLAKVQWDEYIANLN
jgi:hypothetical protein